MKELRRYFRRVLTTHATHTPNQIRYREALSGSKPIVVVTGPAGTGKTMLACRCANEDGRRVLLTRPITSEYGFLPGDIDSKFKPWMAPMLDHLDERGVEVVPLGFMRGRTFTNAYIVADEMQNSSVEQMKMLLTRVGANCKLVVAGDPLQSDLDETDDGFADLLRRMQGRDMQTVAHVCMGLEDVMRSEAVKEVLRLYADD